MEATSWRSAHAVFLRQFDGIFDSYLNSLLTIYRFLRLAGSYDFVKFAMLGLGTAHLNCLVKLTELEKLG